MGTRPTDSVRLVITEDRQLTDNYVTLSHCWGKPSPLKLTRQSQKRLVDGVNVSELPLTFQHAIVVAKRLSTKFIWIDSLCIFQDDDDKSDWLREAQLMDKVYTHACLNISATASTDGSQGLFRSRDPAVVLKPTIVSWCPPTNGTQDPREKAEWVLTELFFLNRQLMHEPLHHRAWVLQERLLANRVLHFGASQLFWECKHGVLCERFPDHLPSFMHNFGPATFKSFTGAYGQVFAPTTTATPPDSAMYKLLNKVVDAYSQSLLTYHSDKLIALSGIAKLMQGMFQDEYIVGMWRSCLASQLPWSVQEAMKVNGEPSTRNFAYRAPTWTWMSVEGIINFPFDATCNNLWIEVLDVKLRHATADTTGLALDGHLMLKGRLRPLCLRRLTATLNDQDPELAQRVEEKGISSSAFDRPIPRQWIMTVNGKDLQLPHGKLWERGGPLVHLDVDQPNFDDSNQKGELYMVSAHGPGYDKNDPYASPKEPSTFHKILLLRCVEAKRGVFHRFGVATLDTNKTEIFDFVKEHDVNEADMPCVEYDAKQHLHTIVVK